MNTNKKPSPVCAVQSMCAKYLTVWRVIPLVGCALLLTACGPSEKEQAQIAEEKRLACLDKFCAGDIVPKYDYATEVALKLNGQWFIGPREYFTATSNAGRFEWWNHKPLRPSVPRPPEVQALAVDGKGQDFAIELFFRSNNIPSEPRGYKLIQLAEANSWIEKRSTVRPGLDSITMKHVIGPRGYYIDHVTYYAATNLKGVDGLPPVATCAHDSPDGSGGTGFMWKPGIWLGTRMNQKHCADWPEIYQEITRVLQLIKNAKP